MFRLFAIFAFAVFSTCNVLGDEANDYINSPYYPLPYPALANDSWLIDLPNINAKVLLQFEKLDLRSTSGSTTAANLDIRDGPLLTSPRLAYFTSANYTAAVDYQCSSSRAYIKFNTSANPGAEGSGFRLIFRSIHEHNILNSSEGGIIQSPNYPQNYGNNQLVQWSINLPQANLTRLEILDFETEETQDHLEIRKASDINSVVETVLSGNLGNYTFVNEAPSLFLRFYSNEINNAKGFRAMYFPGYKYSFSQQEGEIYSSNYPDNYGNWSTEYWLITNPYADGKILLEFDDFDTEPGLDILTVRDGNNASSPILGTHSGSELPQTYLSSGKPLFVTFLSNGENTRKGFHARFTAVHQDTTLPPEPICILPGVYRVPFPGFCEKFYLCVNYEEHEQECAPGLYFDPDLGDCNLAAEVDCPWAPTTQAPTSIEPSTEPSICPPTGIVYIPIPEDCSSYILCAEGMPITQRCPAGTLFDPVALRCAPAEDVECLTV